MLILIGGVAYYAATSGGHVARAAIGTMDLGISYGDTPAQVQHRLGAASSKSGACWVYRATEGTVSGVYAGTYIDAVRFCFSAHVVTDVHDHMIAHTIQKRRFAARWILPLTMVPAFETATVQQ
jgi:hypothetical protein